MKRERERDSRERETAGTLSLHICIFKTLVKTFSNVGSGARVLSQETLVTTRFVEKTRRLKDSGSLVTQGTIFFGTLASLALGWFPGQPVGVLEFAVHGKKPLATGS